MSDYRLQITFNSNERPFSTTYHPIPWAAPKNDASAKEWASGMATYLGKAYSVTLFKDEKVLEFEDIC